MVWGLHPPPPAQDLGKKRGPEAPRNPRVAFGRPSTPCSGWRAAHRPSGPAAQVRLSRGKLQLGWKWTGRMGRGRPPHHPCLYLEISKGGILLSTASKVKLLMAVEPGDTGLAAAGWSLQASDRLTFLQSSQNAAPTNGLLITQGPASPCRCLHTAQEGAWGGLEAALSKAGLGCWVGPRPLDAPPGVSAHSHQPSAPPVQPPNPAPGLGRRLLLEAPWAPCSLRSPRGAKLPCLPCLGAQPTGALSEPWRGYAPGVQPVVFETLRTHA